MPDRLYLTTAIPFVNGSPHLGHALEYVQTDVLARHARARGRAVRFLTGTDEHAAKNVQAAPRRRRGRRPAFVAAQRGRLPGAGRRARRLVRRLPPHQRRPAAPARGRGDLAPVRGCRRPVPRAVRGLVLRGLRGVLRPRLTSRRSLRRARRAARAGRRGELVLPPVPVPRRARRADRGVVACASSPTPVATRCSGFLAGPVRDLSVSRPRAGCTAGAFRCPAIPSRSSTCGSTRLTNYIERARLRRRRRRAVSRVVVRCRRPDARDRQGHPAVPRRDLARDPAARPGEPLPSTLLVHDYVTANGRKIGKSLGNAVDPVGADRPLRRRRVRWWLCREVPRVGEADFTEDAARRDVRPRPRERCRQPRAADGHARGACVRGRSGRSGSGVRVGCEMRCHPGPDRCRAGRFSTFAARRRRSWSWSTRPTATSSTTRPWVLLRAGDRDAARAALAPLVAAVRVLGAELEPFVPALASRVATRIGPDGGPVAPGSPLQKRITA